MKKKFEENFEYLLYWISLAVVMLLLTCSAVYAQPTRKEVLNYILNHTNIICPEVVFKQAVYETNCGKTGVGKSRNNLFGFMGSNGSYMTFKTWEESVCYYEKWQKKRLYQYLEIKPPGDIDYYHFLWYIGYNDGKKYGQQGKIYIDKLKNLSVKL